jgi:anthranilate synthase component 1
LNFYGRETIRLPAFFIWRAKLKIKPAFSEFAQMAQAGNLIPVYQEFLADTETPVSAYLKLKDNSYSYLLESAEGGTHWGRYSFIGCKPYLRAISHDSCMEICEGHENKVFKNIRNPLDVMRDLCARFKPVSVKDLPPFQGGFVGFFNYDLVRKWEHFADKQNASGSCFHRLPSFDYLRSFHPYDKSGGLRPS